MISSHKGLNCAAGERKQSGTGILLGRGRGRASGEGKDMEVREAQISQDLGRRAEERGPMVGIVLVGIESISAGFNREGYRQL